MPRLHPAAREEIRAAAAWYDDQVIGLGELLLDDVDRALAKIDAFPRAGAPWSHRAVARGIRVVSLRRFRYRVFYVLEPDPFVVAFAHSAREPDWLERVDDAP